jgi:hypothetical protein
LQDNKNYDMPLLEILRIILFLLCLLKHVYYISEYCFFISN